LVAGGDALPTSGSSGELTAAAAVLDELVDDLTELPFIASMRTLLLCELDRPNEARRRLDDLVAQDGFASVPFDQGWLITLTNLAAVAARLHHRRAAEMLSPLLAPHGSQIPFFAVAVNGAVSLYLGMLARTLDAARVTRPRSSWSSVPPTGRPAASTVRPPAFQIQDCLPR
jgi:hypothetical protein